MRTSFLKIMTVSAVSLALVGGLAACGSSEDEPIVAERGLPTGQNAGAKPGKLLTPQERANLSHARFALSCVNQQYPNEISHLLNSAEDVASPKDLHPAFYGCFNWSGAVLNHWALIHLWGAGEVPELDSEIKAVLARSFTQENIDAERRYFMGEERDSFERPYGMAWFLQLTAELRTIVAAGGEKGSQAKAFLDQLAPLETTIVEELKDWLMKLRYPVRSGTQSQSAFAMALILDWSQNGGDEGLGKLARDRARQFYMGDANCPITYEPSGQDLLSPCLMQADLMRRMMGPSRFSDWLGEFLPGIPADGMAAWIRVATVKDPSDKKLGQLNGLNLSRAWALQGIASGLEADDPRRDSLLKAAKRHRRAGLASVNSKFYASTHWLPSFATYLESGRGLAGEPETGSKNGVADSSEAE